MAVMNNGLLRCVNKSTNIFGLLGQYVDSARHKSFQDIDIFSYMLYVCPSRSSPVLPKNARKK